MIVLRVLGIADINTHDSLASMVTRKTNNKFTRTQVSFLSDEHGITFFVRPSRGENYAFIDIAYLSEMLTYMQEHLTNEVRVIF